MSRFSIDIKIASISRFFKTLYIGASLSLMLLCRLSDISLYWCIYFNVTRLSHVTLLHSSPLKTPQPARRLYASARKAILSLSAHQARAGTPARCHTYGHEGHVAGRHAPEFASRALRISAPSTSPQLSRCSWLSFPLRFSFTKYDFAAESGQRNDRYTLQMFIIMILLLIAIRCHCDFWFRFLFIFRLGWAFEKVPYYISTFIYLLIHAALLSDDKRKHASAQCHAYQCCKTTKMYRTHAPLPPNAPIYLYMPIIIRSRSENILHFILSIYTAFRPTDIEECYSISPRYTPGRHYLSLARIIYYIWYYISNWY
jgi:hypothetical protein